MSMTYTHALKYVMQVFLIKQRMDLGSSRLDNIAKARAGRKNLFSTVPRIFNFKHITVDSFHRK